MKPIPFSVHGVTHKGVVRNDNQDALFISEQWPIFAVADGMGGHEHGAWASASVVEAVASIVLTGSFRQDAAAVSNAVYAANSTIFSADGVGAAHPGSTVAALLFSESKFAAFWAGDSRIYLRRGKKLHQLTHDHTVVQELIDRGALTPDEAAHHPMVHVLARVVGSEKKVNLDMVVGSTKPQDRFLLCSDGLTGTVKDEEISEAMAGPNAQLMAQGLLDLALARGAPDNTTVIAVVCRNRPGLFSRDRAG